ncbi:MAG: nucleoside diphosphate kinase regulator [Hyphomonadaceae bacterium]|nr:nucleoside diphosphate kinase regulator [Hyphomonadaceae bacterium]
MTNRPDIIVTQNDHEELIALALKALGQAPGAAMLLQEMQRAKVVEPAALPHGVLAMNDRVTFDYDGQTYRDFQLVYPQCADFADGRISVLTPVGAALIGLRDGQSISWPADRQGGAHRLTVKEVRAR